MKNEPLDRILLRHGVLNDAQIEQALMRQRARGGQFGTHLLYFKFVTEEELVAALSEQFGVPGVTLSGRQIQADVIARLPVEVAEKCRALPFKYDPANQILHLAVADPESAPSMYQVRESARASDIALHVASELMVRNLIAEHYRGRGRELFLDQIVELPTLFAAEPVGESSPATAATPAPALPRILLISRTAFLKNFLGVIFEREGYGLDAATDASEVALALRSGDIERILVSQEMEAEFVGWITSGNVPRPTVDIVAFGSVSAALLENPAPYRTIAGALLRSMQQMAEIRCAASSWKPPYARICEDLRALGTTLGLRRLAQDGMQIAAHLLVPNAKSGAAHPFEFAEFDRSLEIAPALRFPWDVEGCLVTLAQRAGEIAPPGREAAIEVTLAAESLALVWYRHAITRGRVVAPAALRTELRRIAGRLAGNEVVEAYVRVLDRTAEMAAGVGSRPVLVVGEHDVVLGPLADQLRFGGCRVFESDDLVEAQRIAEREHPVAILISWDRHQERGAAFARGAAQATRALVYAVAQRDRPGLVMDLLDAGFTDAFVAPFETSIVATRIGKALEARAQQEGGVPRGFAGTLRELPFVDLVQVLGGNQRTVAVRLQSGAGENAAVYLRQGEIVHATCGTLAGPDAVFRIIAWREHGSFALEPVTDFPPDNISVSTPSLLLQGCRLLDESRT